MTWREKLTGFYSILDADDEALARLLVTPTKRGGAGSQVLQVRVKPAEPLPTADLVRVARMARRVTAEHGALLIVDDRIDVALAVDADGVHLGQDDLPLADARRLLQRLRPDRPFIVGISTHDRAQVAEAVRGGADYLGFGPIHATTTKARPDPLQGLAGLRHAVAAAGDVPIVAIGGITPETAVEIAACGASAACAIASVNRSQNPAVAGAAVRAAFSGVTTAISL